MGYIVRDSGTGYITLEATEDDTTGLSMWTYTMLYREAVEVVRALQEGMQWYEVEWHGEGSYPPVDTMSVWQRSPGNNEIVRSYTDVEADFIPSVDVFSQWVKDLCAEEHPATPVHLLEYAHVSAWNPKTTKYTMTARFGSGEEAILVSAPLSSEAQTWYEGFCQRLLGGEW